MSRRTERLLAEIDQALLGLGKHGRLTDRPADPTVQALYQLVSRLHDAVKSLAQDVAANAAPDSPPTAERQPWKR